MRMGLTDRRNKKVEEEPRMRLLNNRSCGCGKQLANASSLSNSASWPLFLRSMRVESLETSREMAPSPTSIVMRTGEAVEHLLEQRERYGFSSIPVDGGVQMEKFASVVAQ